MVFSTNIVNFCFQYMQYRPWYWPISYSCIRFVKTLYDIGRYLKSCLKIYTMFLSKVHDMTLVVLFSYFFFKQIVYYQTIYGRRGYLLHTHDWFILVHNMCVICLSYISSWIYLCSTSWIWTWTWCSSKPNWVLSCHLNVHMC